MSHVVMLLANSFAPDPRPLSEATGLLAAGYRVSLIAWDRERQLPATECHQGIEVLRVHEAPSSYGLGARQALRLPAFWRRAVALACKLAPTAIHCHDLDTLPAGWWLKRRLGCPLVYDAHEHYPALMSLYLPKVAVAGLTLLERILLRRVDATIVASSVLADEFRARGALGLVHVGNYPDVDAYWGAPPVEVARLRKRLGVPREQLLVAYIGGLSRNRLLMPLIEAATLVPEAQVHLWGDGAQRDAVEQAVRIHPNARYHGRLPYDRLPLHFQAADVIYYGLREDYAGAIYNAPNTLSQAMAAGRAVIATDVGDLGRVVRATGAGLLLENATPAAVARAIRHLADPRIRAKIGENGRRAAVETYNAVAARRRVVELYARVCYQKPIAIA